MFSWSGYVLVAYRCLCMAYKRMPHTFAMIFRVSRIYNRGCMLVTWALQRPPFDARGEYLSIFSGFGIPLGSHSNLSGDINPLVWVIPDPLSALLGESDRHSGVGYRRRIDMPSGALLRASSGS